MMICCGTHSKELGLWAGTLAFLFGGVILLQMFDVIPASTWDYVWPTALVLGGLKLMILSATKCDDNCCGMSCCDEDNCEVPMAMEMPSKPAKKAKSSKKK